jgi:hypothetical protein
MYNDLAGPLARPEFEPWALGQEPPPVPKEPFRRCPDCEQAMYQVQLEKVVVQRCKDHGVWFDAGELEQVLEHVAQRVAK